MLMQPSVKTFGPNAVTLGFVGGFALSYIVVFNRAFSDGIVEGVAVLYDWGEVGLFALWIAWLLSVKVALHENGIAYQSLFGSEQMLWDEVDRFYYSVSKPYISFIPLGTYYRFTLKNLDGESLAFGNRMARPKELGDLLIQLTYPKLLQKCTFHFHSGSELEFGPIRLSRSGGIQIKKLFRVVTIPLDSVAEYRIEEGSLYMFRVGQKRTTGISIGKIPNAFVLVGLLDAIYKPEAA